MSPRHRCPASNGRACLSGKPRHWPMYGLARASISISGRMRSAVSVTSDTSTTFWTTSRRLSESWRATARRLGSSAFWQRLPKSPKRGVAALSGLRAPRPTRKRPTTPVFLWSTLYTSTSYRTLAEVVSILFSPGFMDLLQRGSATELSSLAR